MPKGPHWKHEQECTGIVCGLDEVGRAPLAGPVVAACVHVPLEITRARFWSKVRDSKQVPPELRAELYVLITSKACYGIGEASVTEIDEINIHYASLLAMQRAHDNMARAYGIVPELALVDGKFVPKGLTCAARAIVGGDDISRSIAAASIVAKVHRDRMMHALHEDHPHFGWNSNVGYPTPVHIRALREHGPTVHHRRSFGVVKELVAA